MPLAVVGSNVVIEVNGKKVRGRQYPWGVAEGRFTRVRRLTGWTRIPSCGLTASRERVGYTVCATLWLWFDGFKERYLEQSVNAPR